MSRSLRALLCVGLLVSFAIYVESRSHGAKATQPLAAAAAASASAAAVVSFENLESSSSSRTSRPINRHMMNMDPFRSSKRRVPNGADPIHNRGEGKSGRPPGRA
ncbi:uncharacterized protein LOC109713164 [Ananas comosus]|uniref:Uncharacterized protein LOC109713164 n=1 Tax=Ananas comosus TaxID=4615 RepID=A0A6P5F9W3_ANACO|nr:uncharacterized protein LOC109713164 [Ananas comosus]